jgi:hypothetical protein
MIVIIRILHSNTIVLTETFLSHVNSNFEHGKPSSQSLWTSAKGSDPAFVFQIRMERTRSFVSDKVRKEASRLISPMWRLEIKRE